ncbi:Riboflavin transporter MCH5 [Colletotrichum aenigma]|uniref:Riboflavin transporter MCH5 n=1 Tax=Colletotrichum aenigma TaxID=1215731 RepID=UPI001873133B|nr:Riboflavin transporter MCH5 [Colletotrichum aenigma]KAF5524537.1 Riboflavin transporter MCH5 [Colletotrichum aenigma]
MSSPSAQSNSDLGTVREAASDNFELESGQQAPPSDAPSLRNTRSADIENRISSWACVLGAFIFLLPSYGFPQAIGTVQAYLQIHQLSGYSARDIGWVTGLYTALTLFLGIQAGPIIDRYGTEVLAPLSTALTLPTFFLLAECKYYGSSCSASASTAVSAAPAFFLLEFVIFGISGIFPTLANWAGYPADTGYNIVAIVNSCGYISRIGAGFLGDKLGHYNVLFTSTCVTIVCVAVTILPFGTTHVQALYVFAVLWGFSSGVFSSLIPACMGKTCQTKDYGRCFGSMNFTVSFALLITVPIGGQILESIGGMALAGLYVGVLCMAGGCILAPRFLLVQSWFDYRVRI